MRYLLAILFLIPVVLFAQVPYDRNYAVGQRASNFGGVGIGNVDDGSTGASRTTGIPTIPLVAQFLAAPPAADDDYYGTAAVFTAGVTAATGEKVQLLTKKVCNTNTATGQPFCRNFVLTFSGNTTGTLVLTVVDAQGKTIQETKSFVAASTYTTAYTGRQITSLNITSGFSDSRTLKVGYGVVFGLDYPQYVGAGATLVHTYDDDGTGFPAAADTPTAEVAGNPALATADRYGTIDFGVDPDATNNYYIVYIPSVCWTSTYAYPTTAWSQMQ